MKPYPKSWAEKFAAELTVEGERVPFERVLAHHLDVVARLRATSGLTWRSMASFLARAGARRADGGQISADQLRVSFARLTRQAATRKTIEYLDRDDNGLVCENHPVMRRSTRLICRSKPIEGRGRDTGKDLSDTTGGSK
jgi:hypothetical protein